MLSTRDLLLMAPLAFRLRVYFNTIAARATNIAGCTTKTNTLKKKRFSLCLFIPTFIRLGIAV